MESSAAARRRPNAAVRYPQRTGRAGGLFRVRRIALVAAMIALVPVAFSYFGTMAEPSNSSLGIRTVEWLREHGAAGLVSQIESTYYALTAPSKGGSTLHSLPRVGYGGAPLAAPVAYRPSRVSPIIQPALPGEGLWRATRPGLEGEPPVLVTTLRDQPEYPRVVAGVAWIDAERTRITMDPGRQEPAVTMPRGLMKLPWTNRGHLLAAFNSGFKLSDSHGGVAMNGHTYTTMQNGQATFVGYTSGKIDVLNWREGPTVPSTVAFARQNLPLIVDEGRASPNLDNGEWGATVGNAILVWRSGIGVDRRGNLIYAAGDNQTVRSLANTLRRAGAVRAMELDINSYWVSFITYGAPNAGGPTNLLAGMSRPATRYLEPDDRDFFAVYSR